MTGSQDMLEVAGRGAERLGPVRASVRDLVESRLEPKGGFRGRDTATDCHYVKQSIAGAGWFCVALFLTLQAQAVEFHVSPNGNDAHAGTGDEPFRTIQKAAAVMEPGDSCVVSAGVYPETVRPARSGKFEQPISFIAATGATVTITGAERFTDWQVHTDTIYRVMVRKAYQVLVDDAPADALPAMPSGVADLRGGWWLSPEGVLYLRCPLDAAPADCDVEVQTRRWAFDLFGLAHVVVRGFDIRAGGIDLTDAKSCRVEDCHIWWGGGYGIAATSNPKTGERVEAAVPIGGRENEIVRSSVVGSTGSAIALLPDSLNNRLSDIRIRSAGGRAGDAYALFVAGTAHTIEQVTVTEGTGGALLCSNVYNARLVRNDFHHTGHSGRGRPVVGITGDGKGTILAFNRFHDNASIDGDGVLLDGSVENYILHHNVIWGQRRSAIRLRGSVRYTFVFNNTCAANGDGLDFDGKGGAESFKGLRFFNNIFAGTVWSASDGKPSEGVSWESNYVGSTPGFIDEAARDFRLKEGSPCIDRGQAAPEFTDEYSGRSPDLGAFEFTPEGSSQAVSNAPFLKR